VLHCCCRLLLLLHVQAAIPLPRLEAALGVQDAAWLHRLAQGKDDEEVKPRMLPKSISCGKTFRAQNVLTSLTAVHAWLLKLGQELQERIEADRQQHQRLPKLLTVSFDSAPLPDSGPSGGSSKVATGSGIAATAAIAAAAAGAAAGAGSSGCQGGSEAPAAGSSDNHHGSSTGPAAAADVAAAAAPAVAAAAAGPGHGRLNAQNWRLGATNISRSCALRHARADAIAADALGLVKKWARDRCVHVRPLLTLGLLAVSAASPHGAIAAVATC
jgi:hypothetical protein